MLIIITVIHSFQPSFYLRQWFGPPPDSLIVKKLDMRGDYLLRQNEAESISDLIRSWIVPSSNEALIAFTTYRWFETLYGKKGLAKIPLLELDQPLDNHHQIMTGNWSRFLKEVYAYRNLKGLLGDKEFDQLIQEYLGEIRNGRRIEFWDYLTTAYPELARTYVDFINKEGYCDLYIDKTKDTIRIRNHGELLLPYKVLVETENDSFLISARSETTFFIKGAVRIFIDPDYDLLESSKRNNLSPNPPIFTYKINRDLLVRYPIYLFPYLWYTQAEGITTGGMIQAGFPLFPKERLLFLRSYYAWRKRRIILESTASLPAGSIRVEPEGRFDGNERTIILRLREREWSFSFTGSHLFDTTDLDSRDFEMARKLVFSVGLTKSPVSCRVDFSPYEQFFSRFTTELEFHYSLLSLRLFGGVTTGSPFRQDLIFLAGSLYPSPQGRIIVQKKGPLSSQEHLNFKGGPWLVGYYGQHQKGKVGYGVNLKIHFGPILLFADLGDVSTDLERLGIRYDFGIGIKWYGVSFMIPCYLSDPAAGESHFAFRWLFSL